MPLTAKLAGISFLFHRAVKTNLIVNHVFDFSIYYLLSPRRGKQKRPQIQSLTKFFCTRERLGSKFIGLY
ncbi:MAG: hypothetical protein DPW09_13650 [Anaerolineae bacterium]|nr:hypothetical protein [Anaerolineae bacterium]